MLAFGPLVSMLAQPGVERIEFVTAVLHTLLALDLVGRRNADVTAVTVAISRNRVAWEASDRQGSSTTWLKTGLGVVRILVSGPIDVLPAVTASRQMLSHVPTVGMASDMVGLATEACPAK